MLLVQVPAAACLVLLVYHAVTRRGARVAVPFFAIYPPLMLAKTWIDQNHPVGGAADYYLNPEIEVAVAGVPLIVPLGWVFAFYCSWSLAEVWLARSAAGPASMDRLLSATSVLLGCVAASIESTGIAMGWWQWAVANTMPRVVLSWAVVGYLFLFPFFFAHRADLAAGKRLAGCAAWAGVMGLVAVYSLGVAAFVLALAGIVRGFVRPGARLGWKLPGYLVEMAEREEHGAATG